MRARCGFRHMWGPLPGRQRARRHRTPRLLAGWTQGEDGAYRKVSGSGHTEGIACDDVLHATEPWSPSASHRLTAGGFPRLLLGLALITTLGGLTVGKASATTAASSMKKGVAAAAYAGDTAKLKALGSTWFYNWSDSRSSAPGLDYVPMVWGGGSATDTSRLAALKKGAQTGRFSALLAFNEPDHPAQANMTPSDALTLWPKLEATGLRLGSPAPANYWDGWPDKFISGALEAGYRVDFVALHFYPDFTNPTGAAQQLRRMIKDAWRKWHKPIWVTEVGALDVSAWGLPVANAPTNGLADQFMRQAAAVLEASPHVERYAWFVDTAGQNASFRFTALYNSAGALTSHGRTFASIAGPVR